MHGTSFGTLTFPAKIVSISGVASATGKVFSQLNGCKVTVGDAQFVLNQPYLTAQGITVVVQLGLGTGRLNAGFESLYAGVIGATFLTRNTDYSLLQLSGDTAFHVFFKDGRVAKIECRGLQVTANFFSPQETLNIRLNQVAEMFKKAETAENKIEKQDRTFSELAKLLRMSANHAGLRKQITFAIGSHVKSVCNGELRPGIIRKFAASLKFIGEDTSNYWWINGGASDLAQPDFHQNDSEPTITKGNLKRMIWEQHQLIDQAIDGSLLWNTVLVSFRQSAERGELGFSAQKRFCANCPVGTGMSEEVGRLPLALLEAGKKPSPLGSKTKTVDRQALQARRAERNKDRPVGMTGSKVNPGEAARKRREAEEALRQSKKK